MTMRLYSCRKSPSMPKFSPCNKPQPTTAPPEQFSPWIASPSPIPRLAPWTMLSSLSPLACAESRPIILRFSQALTWTVVSDKIKEPLTMTNHKDITCQSDFERTNAKEESTTSHSSYVIQWRNDAPATPGGAVLKGRRPKGAPNRHQNVGQFCKINCVTSKITRFVS